ncbi:hypothetical protein ALC62_07112 [Cyphomyrmex costatus]|uniref:Uncharacterized protein n=1 Tax=Cyphomyrmex costatus TaxID=456900 RepID=A0A195CN02_9HYME|nr:hypothetical protein ALC62_07112 [Cyphomyrmex costatus]
MAVCCIAFPSAITIHIYVARTRTYLCKSAKVILKETTKLHCMYRTYNVYSSVKIAANAL